MRIYLNFVIFALNRKSFDLKPLLSHRPFHDVLTAVTFVVVCGILVIAGVLAYRHFISTPPYVDPVKYPVKGIDVSAHNGDIDFSKVASEGFDFVFIKATEGKDFNDRNFKTNYDKARQAGLKTGVYHFFRFDREGVEQGMNFIRTVGTRRPPLGFVIDVEKSGNPDSIPPDIVKKRLFSMVDYLNLLGIRVMFYTNIEGYYDYIADTFPGFPLWICSFHNHPINAEWTFWQHNHHGEVSGIKGDVDINSFCGSREEWLAFLDGEVWPYTPPEKQ